MIALLVGLGFYEFHQFAAAPTNTSTKPFPQVDSGPDVYAASRQKITAFQQAMEKNQPATLRLNSDEINTAIARDPSMAPIRGKVFVKLHGDEATIHSKVKLATLNVALGDYSADFTASLSLAFNPQDKRLAVNLHDFSTKGQTVPANYNATLNTFVNSMIAQQVQANGPARDFLARTQKLTIKNGELIIETK